MKYINVLFYLTIVALFFGSCDNDDDSSGQVESEVVLDYADRIISSDDDFIRNTIQVGSNSDEFFSYIDEGEGDPNLV